MADVSGAVMLEIYHNPKVPVPVVGTFGHYRTATRTSPAPLAQARGDVAGTPATVVAKHPFPPARDAERNLA
jgi:hypothetical protein